MKKLILSLIALSAVSGYGATISVVRSGNGIVASTSAGVLLSSGGYYIGVGSYGDTAPTITDLPSFQAAVASFKEFASATSPTTGNPSGSITGSFSGTGVSATTAPADFNSKSLYILVGNAPTKAGSTEFALLQGTPTWNFVGDVTIGSASATITLIDATAFSPVGIAGTEIDNPTGQDSVQLLPIPEPSAVLLSVVGLGLLASRRRK